MKTNEKVVLPKEVAEAIESLRKERHSNFDVLNCARGALYSEPDLIIRKWAFDDDGAGTPDLLMRALVSGYDIEATPEDRLRKYYEINEPHHVLDSNSNFYRKVGRREGVRKTLDILGITNEGINGKETEQ